MQALSNIVIFALKGKVASALIMNVNKIGTHHELYEFLSLCRGIIVAGLESVPVHDWA
jgi:hypothetical protein